MKAGDTILILPSYSLIEMKLEALIGCKATIEEAVGAFDDIRGCWVSLPEEYLGEKEWYIPYYSIGI